MSIMVKCKCGKKFGVMERHLGKKARCPHCGETMLVEAPSGSSSAPSSGSSSAPASSKPAHPAADKPKDVKPEKPKAAAVDKPKEAAADKAKGPPDKIKELMIAKAKQLAAARQKEAEAAKPKPSAEEALEARKAALAELDSMVEVRSGPVPVAKDGEGDVTSQMASIRHVVQRFCPVCGARYGEHDARCKNCHAPLTPEEIAAAEAAKKPPMFPWLPRVHLSPGAKRGVMVLGAVFIGLIVYVCMLPALNRKARLQSELTLVVNSLVGENLLKLDLDMPGYPWNRPATVTALGKWERRLGPAVLDTYGKGTYDLKTRELLLSANDGGKIYTYRVIAPPLLSLAIQAKDMSLVHHLLQDRSTNVNDVDSRGDTPLHVAAAISGEQGAELVKSLLDHGANAAAVDEKGMTPIAIARLQKNSRVVKALGGGTVLEPGA